MDRLGYLFTASASMEFGIGSMIIQVLPKVSDIASHFLYLAFNPLDLAFNPMDIALHSLDVLPYQKDCSV